jgi:hypothetical protein
MISLIADGYRYSGPKVFFPSDFGTNNKTLFEGDEARISRTRGKPHPQGATSWWPANVFCESFYDND